MFCVVWSYCCVMSQNDQATEPRPTLATIGRDASVSMSTVSKVLNGRSGVSDATRTRVEELLHKHGYSPRGGTTGSASLLEIVFNQLDTPWALELIQGAEQVARENKMSLVLTQSGDRHSPAAEWIDGVLQRRPAGVVLVLSDLSSAHKRQLRTREIPFVVIDPAGDPAPDVPAIGTANWNGGVLATRHLLELGHRRIGVVGGPEDVMSAQARMAGFRTAMESAGVPIDESLITGGNYDVESGIDGGRALLDRTDRPTAIFAMNDLTAFGVYEAARSLAISIPGDLSVIGFDDLQMAQWAGPPLTTIRQPLTQMAQEAARLVIRLRSSRDTSNIRVDLATSLVVRGSARPLAG